jgi:hypothetical protein
LLSEHNCESDGSADTSFLETLVRLAPLNAATAEAVLRAAGARNDHKHLSLSKSFST